MSQTDIEKVNLITVSAQANDLIVLLYNIDKNNLHNAMTWVLPQEHDSPIYKSLVCVMDFYNAVENIKKENEKQDTYNN